MLISDACVNMKVSDAVNSGAHFSALKKWNEKEITLSMVALLSELLQSVPNNMTPDDIVYMARSIVIDSGGWKPDDILIVFRNGKQGKYGKIYGNFSYQVFNEWVEAYAKERQSYFDNKHLDTKEQSTTREDTKQMIYRERRDTHPTDIKLPDRMGRVIADENYFKPKQ